jgi:hypothetical protein
MIHIEKHQDVPMNNPQYKVVSETGDYGEEDFIDCAYKDDETDEPICQFSASIFVVQ